MEVFYQTCPPGPTGRRADRIIGFVQQLPSGLYRGFYPNDEKPLTPNAQDYITKDQALDFIYHQFLCREIVHG